MCKRLKRLTAIAGICLCLYGEAAHAFLVMASLNTYKESRVPNAILRVDEFHADGVWFIAANSDFRDTQYREIFNRLGGIHISEDNPTADLSYRRYVRVMDREPRMCFCYNETGGEPGGTLLSDTQIDTQYASHGERPLVCLTRAYVGTWKQNVDRCLANAKVGGICMEYVKSPLLNIPPGQHNGAPQNVRAVIAAGKKCYILLHAAGDRWTDAENRRIIENLNRWSPDEMASDSVILVYQNYDTGPPGNTTEDWLGARESVASAIRQAKTMPNYSGNKLSFSFGRRGHLDGWTPNSSIMDKTITPHGEYLFVARSSSDPFLSNTGIRFNGSQAGRVRVRVKAEQAGHMQLFWGIEGDNTYRPSRSATATYRVAKRWQQLEFDLSENPKWVGKNITRLRFDSTSGSGLKRTWIDYIVGDQPESHIVDRDGEQTRLDYRATTR